MPALKVRDLADRGGQHAEEAPFMTAHVFAAAPAESSCADEGKQAAGADIAKRQRRGATSVLSVSEYR